MQFAQEFRREGGPLVTGGPALARKMGDCQLLQVALFRLRGEIAAQRGLDVGHPGLLAFDQVGIIAVHPARDLAQVFQ